MLFDDTVILLFAKAPVAGYVNTRLIPEIGVQAATELQYDLIRQRLAMLSDADLCSVYLMCAPDCDHELFKQCSQHYPVTLYQQSAGDIGDRMLAGIKTALRDYNYCVVIGTDAPALDATSIRQAVEYLHSGSGVVLVPAEDGGYVLVGMSQVYDFIFKDIAWGTGKVMQQTREKLKDHKVSCRELATCWDIDRIEDYLRYLEMKKY